MTKYKKISLILFCLFLFLILIGVLFEKDRRVQLLPLFLLISKNKENNFLNLNYLKTKFLLISKLND